MTIRSFRHVGPDLRRGERQGVYFVRPEGRPFVKIGHGCPVITRIAEIQCGSPEALEVLLILPGGRLLERTIHKSLAGLGKRGEWFGLSHVLRIIPEFLNPNCDFQAVANRLADERMKTVRAEISRRLGMYEEINGEDITDAIIATVLPLSSAGKAA